jgi:hypothetical protein
MRERAAKFNVEKINLRIWPELEDHQTKKPRRLFT